MAFDYDNVDFNFDGQIEGSKRKVQNMEKLEEIKDNLAGFLFERKFQELVYTKVLLLILESKKLYEDNEELQEKLLALPTYSENLSDDELTSALKQLDVVIQDLNIGYIKNTTWTYCDLLGVAISKNLHIVL